MRPVNIDTPMDGVVRDFAGCAGKRPFIRDWTLWQAPRSSPHPISEDLKGLPAGYYLQPIVYEPNLGMCVSVDYRIESTLSCVRQFNSIKKKCLNRGWRACDFVQDLEDNAPHSPRENEGVRSAFWCFPWTETECECGSIWRRSDRFFPKEQPIVLHSIRKRDSNPYARQHTAYCTVIQRDSIQDLIVA